MTQKRTLYTWPGNIRLRGQKRGNLMAGIAAANYCPLRFEIQARNIGDHYRRNTQFNKVSTYWIDNVLGEFE